MKYMNRLTHYIAIGISLLLFSCGTTQTATEKADKSMHLSKQIENFNFKFLATYAYPQSFSSIYLSSYYDVSVSTEAVTAHLPYYGRAYTASIDSREGGIKFESKDFEYDVEKGKREGNWIVTIHTKDTSRPFTLYFNLWDNGTGRLDVMDQNRQSISFQGTVEPAKEK